MLLALDIASKFTGYAYGSESDAAPVVGVWRFTRHKTLAAVTGDLTKKIGELCETKRVKVVVIEAPVHRFRYRDKKTGRRVERSTRAEYVLKGLVVAAEGAAHNAGAERIDQKHVSTWRKHFTGLGRYTKREEAKAATIAMCERLGWKSSAGEKMSEDEADAAGLWCLAMSSIYPKWAPNGTPLFAGRDAA